MKTLEEYAELVVAGRLVSFSKDIDAMSCDKFRDDFVKCTKNVKDKDEDPIGILINTNGGEAMRSRQTLIEIRALSNVYNIWLILGSPNSSGGLILSVALPVEKRVALPSAMAYAHLGRQSIPKEDNVIYEQIEYTKNEIGAGLTLLGRNIDTYAKLLAAGTELSLRGARDLIRKPRYLTPREMIKLGFASRILK